eukprot:IDg18695t1
MNCHAPQVPQSAYADGASTASTSPVVRRCLVHCKSQTSDGEHEHATVSPVLHRANLPRRDSSGTPSKCTWDTVIQSVKTNTGTATGQPAHPHSQSQDQPKPSSALTQRAPRLPDSYCPRPAPSATCPATPCARRLCVRRRLCGGRARRSSARARSDETGA